MSKTYKCRVIKDLSEKLREEDRVIYRLRVLPVATKEKMNEWIKESLLKAGAVEETDGTLRLETEGVRVEVDLEHEEVRIIAESEEGVHLARDEERTVYNARDNASLAQLDAEQKVEQEMVKEMKQLSSEARVRLRRQAKQLLKDAEPAVKTIIRKAENEAVAKGLDLKARELGEIIDKEESHEPGGEIRLVWRIRLS